MKDQMKLSEYFPFLFSFFSSRRCNDVPVQTKRQERRFGVWVNNKPLFQSINTCRRVMCKQVTILLLLHCGLLQRMQLLFYPHSFRFSFMRTNILARKQLVETRFNNREFICRHTSTRSAPFTSSQWWFLLANRHNPLLNEHWREKRWKPQHASRQFRANKKPVLLSKPSLTGLVFTLLMSNVLLQQV